MRERKATQARAFVSFGNQARGFRPARIGNLNSLIKGVPNSALVACSMRTTVLMFTWSRKTKGALVSGGKSTDRSTSQRPSQQHRLTLVKQSSK